MKKELKRKPLNELNLTNRFLFAVDDEQNVYPSGHPVCQMLRMGALRQAPRDKVYNTEMQDERKSDLAKRSRYYQALIDTSLLEPGVPNYNALNTSYIIVIMSFDLFGYGKYRYTFLPRCQEVPELCLEDGSMRIFLSTEGKNDDEVSEELVDFLHYIKNSTDEVAEKAHSVRIHRLHQRVCKVKASEKVGVRYMQAWEERYYDREEGRIEGRIEGRNEGRRQAKQELIANMRREGLPDELILRVTKLTKEELEKIAE